MKSTIAYTSLLNGITTKITGTNYHDILNIVPPKYRLLKTAQQLDVIIESALQQKEKNNKPCLLNVCGIPGSGKTTFCNQLQNKREMSHFLFLSFDSIMEKITHYQADKQICAIRAFENWELPARIIGYEILCRAVKRKISIVFEHSSALDLHLNLFETIKMSYGYHIKMRCIKVELDVVISRLKKRKEENGRHTPTEYIRERYYKINQLAAAYKRIINDYKEITL